LWFDSNKNFETVYQFIVTVVETYLDIPLLIREDDNFKDRMQKHCQHTLHYTPIYKIVSCDEKTCLFVMSVCSPQGEVLGIGTSNTKKSAEQFACKNALQKWGVI
jgi:dsRNA-specific ribonuclease